MVHIELLYDFMIVRKSKKVVRLCNMSDKSGVYSIQVCILKNHHTVESTPLSNVHIDANIYWFLQALQKRSRGCVMSFVTNEAL